MQNHPTTSAKYSRLASNGRRRYISLAIDVSDLTCLIVGGGRVGTRKALTLARQGARVTVLSPDISTEIKEHISDGTIRWEQATYSKSRLDGFSFIVAATADPALNIQIGRDAKESQALCCVVSPGRFSQVIFPATHTQDNVTVAVHSDGRDCAHSKQLRNEIALVIQKQERRRKQLVALGVKRSDLPPDVFDSLARHTLTLRMEGRHATELFAVATCQRWECYALATSPRTLWTDIRSLLQCRTGILAEKYGKSFYQLCDTKAYHHLLRVVSGLDSSLQGETDIVGQVRSALRRSPQIEMSPVGEIIASSLHAQQAIRKDSRLSPADRSWANVTVSLLANWIPPFLWKRVLLVGCGRLGEAIASALSKAGASVLPFSQRAHTSGVAWASALGLVVHHPSEIPDFIASADAAVLISELPEVTGISIGRHLGCNCRVVIDLSGKNDAWFTNKSRYIGLKIIRTFPTSGEDASQLATAEKLAVKYALDWHSNQSRSRYPHALIKIGARPSKLSEAQVGEVCEFLQVLSPEIILARVGINTPGDLDKETPLPSVREDDFFTRHLDAALLGEEIDLAVHSAKDLPARIPDGLYLAALTPSFAPWECLVTRDGVPLENLPSGAHIGTSSVRRSQRLSELREDLLCCDVRGDIHDRIAQLDAGKFDGLILAVAGLLRSGLQDRISQVFSPQEFPPEQGQGSLALIVRSNDSELRNFLKPLDLGGGKYPA